jgi:uncharacterized protein (DUF2141 family)
MHWVGLVAALIWGAAPTGPWTASIQPSDIDVEIVGLRNDDGQMSCVLYADADAFPTHPEHAAGGMRVDIHDHLAHCVFHDVRPGTYAIAVHHDENGNTAWTAICSGCRRRATASRATRGPSSPRPTSTTRSSTSPAAFCG